MTSQRLNIRLSLVCLAAFSVALPIAIISLAKLLLFICVLVLLTSGWFRRTNTQVRLPSTVPPMILLALAAMATSILWSTGTNDEALRAIVKHGKLALIPAFLLLVRSRDEALTALACFMGGQVLLLASTWLLVMGIAMPWAKNPATTGSFAIFSSYLDQSIMTGVLAAMCWHLKVYAPGRWRTLYVPLICVLALACVFVVFQGRTGYVVAAAMVALAALWEMPRRLRISAFVIPLVLLALLAVNSSKISLGLMEIARGVATFNNSDEIANTSSGIRLNLWRRALQSILENPGRGTGAGSWGRQLNREEELHGAANVVKIAANPHQEYLLWGIELGVPGIALLFGVLFAIYRDSQHLGAPERKALLSLLAALALASLFNCALYDAMIGDFFCIALAVVLALGMHAPPSLASGRAASTG